MVVKKRQSSMADVALLAGVSLGTVSNYFNRPNKVSAERRRRVEAAVEELGFVPSGLARALARGHQQVVALVVLDLNNPYFSVAARGMEDHLAPEGILLTVASSDENRGTREGLSPAVRGALGRRCGDHPRPVPPSRSPGSR